MAVFWEGADYTFIEAEGKLAEVISKAFHKILFHLPSYLLFLPYPLDLVSPTATPVFCHLLCVLDARHIMETYPREYSTLTFLLLSAHSSVIILGTEWIYLLVCGGGPMKSTIVINRCVNYYNRWLFWSFTRDRISWLCTQSQLTSFLIAFSLQMEQVFISCLCPVMQIIRMKFTSLPSSWNNAFLVLKFIWLNLNMSLLLGGW